MVRKKTKKTKRVMKGNKYMCRECGLVVAVDETCGCVDVCDILCCGEQMVKKVRKAKKSARKKKK